LRAGQVTEGREVTESDKHGDTEITGTTFNAEDAEDAEG